MNILTFLISPKARKALNPFTFWSRIALLLSVLAIYNGWLWTGGALFWVFFVIVLLGGIDLGKQISPDTPEENDHQ